MTALPSTPVPCFPASNLRCPNQQDLPDQQVIPWELWVILAVSIALAIICLIGWIVAAQRARRAADGVDVRRDQGPVDPAVTATHQSQPGQQAARQVIDELIALDDLTVSSAMSSQVGRILRTVGAEKDSPEPGSPFDPNLHTAVHTVPGNGEGPDTIVDVIRPGWRVGNTMIRPAEVSVLVQTAIRHE